ncbi:hypothetical protein NYR54_04950 [Chelativorans sp. SCAU2101]|uniref:Conjugal transfer protein TraD n=1 Tax=Chelativorans petroleitrophicus TaxID=2975484 RepID=A0A9X3AZE7_9HYPH|nr:hypothetical protein [Chelativorans petroleitrophicus]MCT8989644.1 hypothetical protein [Chelativorans petroleitrophicus]
MLDLGKLRARERSLLQRKAKLETDLARLRAREKAAARKDDTRRKIVLGAVVLAAVEAGDVPADSVRRLVRKHAAERDKKLFVGTPFAVADGATESAPPDAPETAMQE